MRTKLANALKDAMKAKDSKRLSTLRLINAAIKDRDIALRGEADLDAQEVSNDDILAILAKMIKQRNDSVKAYEEAGRVELAEGERGEIAIIQEFMPKQMDENEMQNAISAAIEKTGAESIRDMGRVMARLKSDFAGQMDFGKVGGLVKDHLG